VKKRALPKETDRQFCRRKGIVYPGDRAAAERLRHELFHEQLAPFDVSEPSARVVCSCGRRAGKTTLVAIKLLTASLLHPNSLCLYLCFSFQDAKDNIWEILLNYVRLIDPQNPELKKSELLESEPSETLAEIRFTNGSTIRCGGVATRKEARKVLGKKYRLVVMDELQDWDEEVIERTFLKIEPAMIDVLGDIWLIGTPGMVRDGLYWRAASGKTGGWSRHEWDMRKNPHMAAQFEEYLRKACEERGLDVDSPEIQRELFGKWVENVEDRAYRHTEANLYDYTAPLSSDWRHVLGVDLGSVDSTALVVLAYDTRSHSVREVYSWKSPGQDFTEMAEEIQRLKLQFRITIPVQVDPAAGGKQFVTELQNRYGIHAESAEKTDKRMGRGWLNADLKRSVELPDKTRQKIFQVRRDSILLDEWTKLTVDKKGEEDPTAENHLSDSCLYAYRKVRHFRPKVDRPRDLPPPKNGPREVMVAEMAAWELREGERAQRLHDEQIKKRSRDLKRIWAQQDPRERKNRNRPGPPTRW
jgi:hypothetical protein